MGDLGAIIGKAGGLDTRLLRRPAREAKSAIWAWCRTGGPRPSGYQRPARGGAQRLIRKALVRWWAARRFLEVAIDASLPDPRMMATGAIAPPALAAHRREVADDVRRAAFTGD